MTKLEHVAASMYRSIKWGGWDESGWDHAPAGLQEHYLVLAAVAVNSLRGSDEALNAMIDAVLNEKSERSYADRADGATTFDPELQFDKDHP